MIIFRNSFTLQQLRRTEEKPQLRLSRLRRVRPVNAVALDVGGESLANRPLCRVGRIGRAHHLAQFRDRAFAFQRHHDNRTFRHELHQPRVKRALFMHRVKSSRLCFGQPRHAQRQNLEPGMLDHSQNLAGLPRCHGIRLDGRKRSLHAHKRLCTFSPNSAGEAHTVMPASCMALILSEAFPDPPEMMAPACPMRRPGGAVWPAMNPTTGFFTCFLMNSAATSSALPPISPIITMACVSGSSLNRRIESRKLVPMIGSPPIPMHVDWPMPSSVSWPTAS